ncbi:transcriptional regulator with XRE-family HTH domain [Sphingomonas naasensis]|uniref:XRE family transcriptional regulator n=1 Tax=Sphingomonas naasensis TaxID=1344951 RepID=A0A4S1WS20_9SPHN|nr:helix-turn-helix transcriptional regulator [Sphingomonas naasensis]NIJ18974.1 transcriptional regulator with XRE-family HTH domain [Sphingomonas naasensis]TGX46184.1 XRE family transcriptional regulator [Sphingomonas naasensis]
MTGATISSTRSYPPIGMLLREWRGARRMSQLELALECGLSARHLGFVELGKARLSREAAGRVADALALALRERNALLLAAGYSPQYAETDLASPALEQMRGAVDLILRHQEPYPAFVLNRHFDVLMANDAATRVNRLVMQGRESRHGNLLRQIFDPDDFRAVIDNWQDVAAGLLRRLQAELAANPGDARGRALLDELLGYPGVPPEWRFRAVSGREDPVLGLVFRSPTGPLRFFETITTFATPLDVTLDELRIDCAFPADQHTAEVCRRLASP